MHKRHGIAGIERPAIGKSLAGAIALTKTGIDVKIDFGTAVIEIGAGIAAHLVNNLVIDAAGYTAEETATTVFFQNDIDDAGRSFGAEFGRRIGNHLDAFDATGRQLFEYLGAVIFVQARRLAVNPNLDTAIAAQRNVAVVVHFDRRNIFEHLGGRTARCRYALIDTEHLFINIETHLRTLSHHFDLVKHLRIFDELQRAQIDGLRLLFDCNLLIERLIANKRNLESIDAHRHRFQPKFTIDIGNAAANHLVVVGQLEHHIHKIEWRARLVDHLTNNFGRAQRQPTGAQHHKQQ